MDLNAPTDAAASGQPMQPRPDTSEGAASGAYGGQAAAFLDALLYSASHDLRSPLLTMTLSAELIEGALGGADLDGTGGVAMQSLRQGAADLERMLQALTLVSRARRGEVEAVRCPLRVILGGYEVDAAAGVLQQPVLVDPLVVRETLDALVEEGVTRVSAEATDGAVALSVPAGALDLSPSPLEVLLSSLKEHAGGPLEAMAVRQVLIERQGGAMAACDGRVVITLPLAPGRASA